MPTQLPSISKFEGKSREDPTNHVMSFHLWWSSNRIIEDFICLRLFQRTLMGLVAKWYINQPIGIFTIFEGIAKALLSFFQLPNRHDKNLGLLNGLFQSIATHIVDHIHEWRI